MCNFHSLGNFWNSIDGTNTRATGAGYSYVIICRVYYPLKEDYRVNYPINNCQSVDRAFQRNNLSLLGRITKVNPTEHVVPSIGAPFLRCDFWSLTGDIRVRVDINVKSNI